MTLGIFLMFCVDINKKSPTFAYMGNYTIVYEFPDPCIDSGYGRIRKQRRKITDREDLIGTEQGLEFLFVVFVLHVNSFAANDNYKSAKIF